jgi:hypothetical protein
MRVRVIDRFVTVWMLTAASVSWASPRCPSVVTEAAAKAVPGGKIIACKAEREHDKQQFEIKLDSDGKRIELDISPEGAVLQTEERVELAMVPAPVMTALAAKYPGSKAERAEKQTKTGSGVSYEIAFVDQGKRHEATFSADGTFLEAD